MTLNQIRRFLRKGGHPETIKGRQCLGSGSFRTAWRIGNFVVKRRTWFHQMTPAKRRKLAKEGILVAKTWRVGRWEIQPYYRHMSEKAFWAGPQNEDGLAIRGHRWWNLKGLDLQSFNMGYDKQGRFVVFDW